MLDFKKMVRWIIHCRSLSLCPTTAWFFDQKKFYVCPQNIATLKILLKTKRNENMFVLFIMLQYRSVTSIWCLNRNKWYSETYSAYLSFMTQPKQWLMIHASSSWKTKNSWYQTVDTLRPRQNRRHFADDIFKCIFLNKNVWISINISLKFVPKCHIDHIPALVQIMAWRRSGDKPLSEHAGVLVIPYGS